MYTKMKRMYTTQSIAFQMSERYLCDEMATRVGEACTARDVLEGRAVDRLGSARRAAEGSEGRQYGVLDDVA